MINKITDERNQFEAYIRSECDSEDYANSILEKNSGGFYHTTRIQGSWEGWQARSKVAAKAHPVALTDEFIDRNPVPGAQAPAGFDERETLIWSMGRSSIEKLELEPAAFIYQDDQDFAEPGTGSCVVSKARCMFYRNETPLYAATLAAPAELTDAELSQIILKRTNPIAAEKYGDTFLRIAQAVQREVIARICRYAVPDVAAQLGLQRAQIGHQPT